MENKINKHGVKIYSELENRTIKDIAEKFKEYTKKFGFDLDGEDSLRRKFLFFTQVETKTPKKIVENIWNYYIDNFYWN